MTTAIIRSRDNARYIEATPLDVSHLPLYLETMASQSATEFELRRLAVRAKLGIDEDARSIIDRAEKEAKAEVEQKKLHAKDAKDPEAPPIRQVNKAKKEGKPVEVRGEPLTKDPLVIQKRIDGSFKHQNVSPELKEALVAAYESDLGINVEELAKATGIGTGVIYGALGEHPKRRERARANREASTTELMEQTLNLMAQRLRDAVASGDVAPNSKNIRDYMIAFGILKDKHTLATGNSGAQPDNGEPETLAQRKARLSTILDRADLVIGLIASPGKQANGSRPK